MTDEQEGREGEGPLLPSQLVTHCASLETVPPNKGSYPTTCSVPVHRAHCV